MNHKAGHTRPRRAGSRRAWLPVHALTAYLILLAATSCVGQPRQSAVATAPAGAPTAAAAVDRTTAAAPTSVTRPQSSGANTPVLGPTAEGARQQTETPVAGKEALTPAQQKIDSNLLTAIKQRRGEAGAQPLETGVQVDANGRAVVDITAFVTPALLDRLKELGAEVLFSSEKFRSLRARVALSQIETIAEQPDVIFIQPKQGATTMPQSSPPPSSESLAPGSPTSAVVP